MEPMKRNAHTRQGYSREVVTDPDVLFLFDLLDDIDTASDIFKPEKTPFYDYVMKKALKRWNRFQSDGYEVFKAQKENK